MSEIPWKDEELDLVKEEDESFKEEEFTEGELCLLKLAFKLVDEIVEMEREYPYPCDIDMSDDLYNLKCKLGIYDLLD